MKRAVQPLINQAIIDELCDRVRTNKRVQRSLPGDGFLRIDRQLPFLCVYRSPSDQIDPKTSRLVRSEAAYLVMPETKYRAKYKLLLDQLVETLSQVFGTFLLIELWAGEEV